MPVNRVARARSNSRARASSAIRGSKSFRRLLKGLPEAMRVEMADVLTKTGPAAAAIVSGRVDATTKRRTGALRAGVKWKVYPRTLRLQVGYLGTKAGRAKLFYARILDLGRKAQTVTVSRRKVAGSLLVGGKRVSGAPYKMKVRAIAAKRFITGGIGGLRQAVGVHLNGVWDRAIRRVAAGDE
jgi:hypothetical protein